MFSPVNVNKESDVGVIACSSGSTGPSKCKLGIQRHNNPFYLTHRWLHSTGLCLHYDVPLFMRPNVYDSNNVVYCCDAIYWTIGIKQILDCLFSNALRIITTKSYTPETPLQLIEKYKVTILPIAAFDLIACLKTDRIRTVDLSSVREIYVYGGHVPNNLIAQVTQYFRNAKITVWYGMTEIGMVSFCEPQKSNKNGGTFADGFTIKIVDEDGNRCRPNVSGELCLKKGHTFRCYLDDPVATACALDNEGFFLTGDIAYIDDNGRLFIKDRKKNILTVFYFDGIVLPYELEEYLINMPCIEEVCIVGVPIADGAVFPAAVIVSKPNSNLCKREIFDKIEGE